MSEYACPGRPDCPYTHCRKCGGCPGETGKWLTFGYCGECAKPNQESRIVKDTDVSHNMHD